MDGIPGRAGFDGIPGTHQIFDLRFNYFYILVITLNEDYQTHSRNFFTHLKGLDGMPGNPGNDGKSE